MSPVCETCNDTHLMPYGGDRVMCTRCPVPCQRCRAGGTGAFCGKTLCECQCHYDQRRVRELLDASADGQAAERARIVAWIRSGHAPFSRAAMALLIEQGAHSGAENGVGQ